MSIATHSFGQSVEQSRQASQASGLPFQHIRLCQPAFCYSHAGLNLHEFVTWLQKTLLTLKGFRIDQQLNGPVVRAGQKYLQLAVQSGSNLYAAVMVPVGSDGGKTINVSAGGIRKALFQSLEDHTVHAFTKSSRKSWSWVLVVSAALILVL